MAFGVHQIAGRSHETEGDVARIVRLKNQLKVKTSRNRREICGY